MKLFLLIAALGFLAPVRASEPDLTAIRQLYLQAPSSESHCRQLLQLVNGYSEKSHPLLAGYKAAATMIMAKHLLNPFSKLSHFNKGKKWLQEAVAADAANVELRFLRYSIQKSAPSFLGYRDEMPADELFLKNKLPSLRDAGLKQMILGALNQS